MIKMKFSKLLIAILLIIIFLMIFANSIFAADMNQIYNGKNDKRVSNLASNALGVVQVVGYSAAVIMLAYIGIKYILSTPDGKADMKKQLIMYVIGAIILFGGATIAVAIGKTAREEIKTANVPQEKLLVDNTGYIATVDFNYFGL